MDVTDNSVGGPADSTNRYSQEIKDFNLARHAANAAFSLVKLSPDYLLDSSGTAVNAGSRRSGPLAEAWSRWLKLWGLIYSGRDRTALGTLLSEETIAECAMTIGCMYGKSYTLSSDQAKLEEAFRWLAKARRHWASACGILTLDRSDSVEGDSAATSFQPGPGIRLVKNAVRELGFLLQGGRIGAEWDAVVAQVRRVLPGGARDGVGVSSTLQDHCGCTRLPCPHSRQYRIDVGPFSLCSLTDKEHRDLIKNAIPTLQLADHFIAALRRSLKTEADPRSSSTASFLDGAEWPRLAVRLPAAMYDDADCIEADRLCGVIVADCCSDRHKFMRMSITALRVMWATELEKAALPVSPRPPRIHPVKRLLYRRPVEDLVANAAAMMFSGTGAIALYVSAEEARGRVAGCQMGRNAVGGTGSVLTIDDLNPFFRRPLFLVIDSAAGSLFCTQLATPSRSRFERAAVVLAPRSVPIELDSELDARGGTWLSYFVHAPAHAFWALHRLSTTVDLDAVERGLQVLDHLVTRHFDRFASDFQHFLRDPFLRRLVVRFVFFQYYAMRAVVESEPDLVESGGVAALQDTEISAIPQEVTDDIGLATQVERLRGSDRRAGKRRRVDPETEDTT